MNKREDSSAEKTGVAVIGCGAIHGMHAGAIANLPSLQLIGVADCNKERALASAGKYGCQAFENYHELLGNERVQAVHICLPHYLHALVAIEALRAGKHVFCEKPMAISTRDAEAMLEASEKSGRKLGICLQNRYNPSTIKVWEMLSSGKAGRLLGMRASLCWHREPEYYIESGWRGKWATEGGGVLINQAIHTLDLMQWLGGKVEEVSSCISTRLLSDIIEVEDTADVTLRFQNGAVGLLYATNTYVENAPLEVEIICENMRFHLCNGLTVIHPDGKTESFDDNNDRSDSKFYWGNSHERIIRDFYSRIAGGQAPAVDGYEGITVIRLLDAIYQSAKAGRKIVLAAGKQVY